MLVKKAKSAVAPGEMESLEISAEKLGALLDSGDSYVKVYINEMGGDNK